MKLTTIATTAVLFAGSLQASIIANQSTGLGLTAGANTILQDFSNPTTPISGQAAFGSANTGSLFSNLSVSSNTALYYDPNGSGASCNQGGSQPPATGTLPTMTACVGNFATNTGGWGGTSPHFQAQGQTANESVGSSFLPDLAINFDTPVYSASFLFGVPSNGAGTLTYEIQLFNSSNQQVDTTYMFKGSLGATPYIQIAEGQAFTEVLITQLASSGTNGYGSNEFNGTTGYTFNALVGNVQASTVAPEPGTIGLLGLGLAGVGYFARKRKKA